MRPDQLLRSTVAGAFSFTARVLTTAADLTSEVARRAGPEGPAGRREPFGGLERAAETADRAAERAGREAAATAEREAAATAERALAGAGERAEDAGERAGEAAERAADAGRRTAKKASAAARRARAAAASALDEPAGEGTVPQADAGPPSPGGEQPATVAADEPAGATPARVRTYDTHAAEIADQPAARVIAAVRNLSTDELRQLYEHEAGHKKRKTVLEAIEAGLAPGPG